MGSKLVHPSSPICNQVKLLSEETVMQGTEFSHSHPGQQWYLSRAWIGWGREGSVPFFFFFLFLSIHFHKKNIVFIFYLPCLHPKHTWVRVCCLSYICSYKIYKWLYYFSIFSPCILIPEPEEMRTILLKRSATAVDFSLSKRCLKPHNKPQAVGKYSFRRAWLRQPFSTIL